MGESFINIKYWQIFHYNVYIKKACLVYSIVDIENHDFWKICFREGNNKIYKHFICSIGFVFGNREHIYKWMDIRSEYINDLESFARF